MGAATAEAPPTTGTRTDEQPDTGSDIPVDDAQNRPAAAEPQPATPAAEERQPTQRIVLAYNSDTDGWDVLGGNDKPRVFEGSVEQAFTLAYKALAAEDAELGQVTLAAVPLRSWQPKPVGAKPRDPEIVIG